MDQALSRGIKVGSIVFVAFIVFTVFKPFVIVDAGNRGVVTHFGAVQVDKVLGEGFHWVIPFYESVKEVNVQIRKAEGDGDAASKDLQTVHARIALNFHLKPAQVAQTYQDIGDLDTVAERIISPAVQEAVKAVTAKYTAEELITKRPEVRDQINSFVHARMDRHGIALDEFSIVNFRFSDSFNASIEAKVTAEQNTLKAQKDLERIKFEAEQKVATAKAEAESLRLQKQEVTPELVRLREIEMQGRAIEKWNGKLPDVTGGTIPFINVTAK